MSDPRDAHSEPQDELDRLLSDLLTGDLTVGDARTLSDCVADDEHARRRYVRAMNLAANLRYLATSSQESVVRGLPHSAGPASTEALEAARPQRMRLLGVVAALAATLVVASAAVYVALAPVQTQEHDGQADELGPVVGVMADTRDVVWKSEPMAAGDDVAARRMVIDAGSVTVDLRSGVTLGIDGPCEVELATPDRCVLRRGRLAVRVPAGVDGFTVEAPHGVRVVDLGTAFTMSVDEAGEAEVRVTEGRVRVELAAMAGRAAHAEIIAAGDALVAGAAGWRRLTDAFTPPRSVGRATVSVAQSELTPRDLPAHPSAGDILHGLAAESSLGIPGLSERLTDAVSGPDAERHQTLWLSVEESGTPWLVTYRLPEPTTIGVIHVFSSFTDARVYQHYDVEARFADASADDAWEPIATGVTSGEIGRDRLSGTWRFMLTRLEGFERRPVNAVRFRFYPVTGTVPPASVGRELTKYDLVCSLFVEPGTARWHTSVYEIDLFPAEGSR